MNKKAILVSASAVIIGAAILTVTSAHIAKGTRGAQTVNTETIEEKITELNINVSRGDVTVRAADTDTIKIKYVTDKFIGYEITSSNGRLNISNNILAEQPTAWYDRFFTIDFGRDDYVIIDVPRNFTASTNIEANFGNVSISGIAGDLNINSDYGNTEVNACKLKILDCDLDYGDIEIENCTAENIYAELDYGDCELKNTSGNVTVNSSCGDIETRNITGGRIELRTDLGDIEGTISGSAADYRISASASLGDCNLTNKSDGQKTLDVSTDMGDIELNFQ